MQNERKLAQNERKLAQTGANYKTVPVAIASRAQFAWSSNFSVKPPKFSSSKSCPFIPWPPSWLENQHYKDKWLQHGKKLMWISKFKFLSCNIYLSSSWYIHPCHHPSPFSAVAAQASMKRLQTLQRQLQGLPADPPAAASPYVPGSWCQYRFF